MCALLMLCENNLVPFFFFCCRCGNLNRMSPHRKHHCISSTRKRQNHQTLEERLLSLKLILLYFVFFILYYSFCVGGGEILFFVFHLKGHARPFTLISRLSKRTGESALARHTVPSPNTAPLSPLKWAKAVTFSLPCRQLSFISLSIQQHF